MYQDEAPGWIRRLYHLPAQRPKLVLLVALVVGVIALLAVFDFANAQLRIKVDSSIENLLPDDSQTRQTYERMHHQFGESASVVLAISGIDPLSPQAVALSGQLNTQLRPLAGVRSVTTLNDAQVAMTEADSIRMVGPKQAELEDPAARAALRKALQAHPFYGQSLISADGSMSAVVIALMPQAGNSNADVRARDALLQKIRGIARQVVSHYPGAQLAVTGTPVIEAANRSALIEQMQRILPLVAIILSVLLALYFFNLRAVVLSLVVVAWSLLELLASMVLLHQPLNLVTALVPPVVLVIGLTYCIHMLSEFNLSQHDDPGSAAHIQRLLDDIGLPLTFNGLTTAAGFMVLALNPLPAVRGFAMFSALGVVIVLFFSLSVLPALMRVTACKHVPAPGTAQFHRAGRWLAMVTVRYRKRILLVAVIIAVFMLNGVRDIQTGANFVADFPADSTVRMDYELINREFGGANPVYITLAGPVDDYFVRPPVLKAMAQLQAWLKQQPEVGVVTSMVDELRLVNRSMHDNDPAYYTIPDGLNATRLIKQLFLLGGGELGNFVDRSYRHARIVVRLKVQDSAAITAFSQRVEQQLQKLPPGINANLTGTGVLASVAVNQIASGQWIDICVALVVVYLLLALMFTSWKAGLITLFPNLLPVLFYYGLLGYADIYLGPTTALISCIVLGIAVDDTVHFLARFNVQARQQGDERKAVRQALHDQVRPMVLTSLTLVVGFMAFASSDLHNQVQFGVLSALTMAFAFLVNIFVTPALAASTHIVTLWDTLRLDLGRAPHLSIPLFDGLSQRQARIFALLSELQACPAGTHVIVEGEQGGDIFVVVDGRLCVWTLQEGKRVELAILRRGQTLGEVGHFSERRSANVDALDAVRLLRFNDADLENLVRRYPRIAAVVLRNLNRLQAQRIVNTQRQLTAG